MLDMLLGVLDREESKNRMAEEREFDICAEHDEMH
jgi:hypothetical protein